MDRKIFKRYFFYKLNTISFSKHQIFCNIGEKDETGHALVPRGYTREEMFVARVNKIVLEFQHGTGHTTHSLYDTNSPGCPVLLLLIYYNFQWNIISVIYLLLLVGLLILWKNWKGKIFMSVFVSHSQKL